MIHPAYLAGLIDGDGCITAFLKKIKTSPHGHAVKGRVKITSKSLKLLEAIKKEYGGKITNRGDGLYDLSWENFNEIKSILTKIIPYLIEKREQASHLQALCLLKHSRDFHEKCKLIRKIQELNSGRPLPEGG